LGIAKPPLPPHSLIAYARQIKKRTAAFVADYEKAHKNLESHWQLASESYTPDRTTKPNPSQTWWKQWFIRMHQRLTDRFQNADDRRKTLFQREIARNRNVYET